MLSIQNKKEQKNAKNSKCQISNLFNNFDSDPPYEYIWILGSEYFQRMCRWITVALLFPTTNRS